MSNIKFELDATIREDIGKGASRRLRHANKVPAVIYGGDSAPLSLTLCHDKVNVALAHEAFYSHILTLNIGNKKEQVILKSLQRSPSRPRINHMDFLRVRADQKLTMHVPLHFLGEEKAPGAKEGGIFQHLMTDIEVSCLPANLPEYIEVDVSKLALNGSIHLSQIKLPKGVEIVALTHDAEHHDQAVISIHMPRAMEEETAATAEEATEIAGETKAEEGSEDAKKD